MDLNRKEVIKLIESLTKSTNVSTTNSIPEDLLKV
jgi:hypothetical protein